MILSLQDLEQNLLSMGIYPGMPGWEIAHGFGVRGGSPVAVDDYSDGQFRPLIDSFCTYGRTRGGWQLTRSPGQGGEIDQFPGMSQLKGWVPNGTPREFAEAFETLANHILDFDPPVQRVSLWGLSQGFLTMGGECLDHRRYGNVRSLDEDFQALRMFAFSASGFDLVRRAWRMSNGAWCGTWWNLINNYGGDKNDPYRPDDWGDCRIGVYWDAETDRHVLEKFHGLRVFTISRNPLGWQLPGDYLVTLDRGSAVLDFYVPCVLVPRVWKGKKFDAGLLRELLERPSARRIH
jgi:hypothetical protein